MRKAATSIFSTVAATISIVFAFANSGANLEQQPSRFWIAVSLAGVFAIALILIEIFAFFRSQPKRFPPNSEHIKHYMVRWLSSGGRSLILSRDLTWVGNIEKRLLITKAKARELELLIENESELVAELRDAGATIYVYGGKGFVPQSRFTIIDYGRNGARVAIGRVRGTRHEITEHSHPEDIFVLVEDLKDALISLSNDV